MCQCMIQCRNPVPALTMKRGGGGGMCQCMMQCTNPVLALTMKRGGGGVMCQCMMCKNYFLSSDTFWQLLSTFLLYHIKFYMLYVYVVQRSYKCTLVSIYCRQSVECYMCTLLSPPIATILNTIIVIKLKENFLNIHWVANNKVIK